MIARPTPRSCSSSEFSDSSDLPRRPVRSASARRSRLSRALLIIISGVALVLAGPIFGLDASAWAQPESATPTPEPTAGDPATDGTNTDGATDGASDESSDATGAEGDPREDENTTLANAEGTSTAAAMAEARAIPEFDRVRTPTSPAFTILGIAPTEIQRPTTPRDFAIVVASGLQPGDQLTVPRDVAVEVAPYWFFGQKRRTYDDFLRSGVGSNALRSLSISVGSSSRSVPELDDMGVETGNTLTESKFAVGLRTQLYAGKSRADICGGDVQKKTLELAKKLASDNELEDAELADKNLLAVAQITTWDDVLPHLRARDAARKQARAAEKILATKGVSASDMARAQEAMSKANAALAKAQTALEDLVTSRRSREERITGRLNTKKSELAQEGDEKAKEKLQAQITGIEKQVLRARAALAVAEQALDTNTGQAEDKRSQSQVAMKDAEVARDKARVARINAEYKKQLDTLQDICKDASAARMGWNLSTSGALAWVFPESDFADGDLISISGWLTLAHTWKQGVTTAALARVSWNRMDDGDRATIFDTGARVIFARSRFAFSGEAVVRTNTDERGVRAAIVGEYMISKGKWLTISFGKDFSDEASIFTLANLTWGVGGESELQAQKSALSN